MRYIELLLGSTRVIGSVYKLDGLFRLYMILRHVTISGVPTWDPNFGSYPLLGDRKVMVQCIDFAG